MNTAWLDILFLIIAAAVGYGVGLLDKRVTSALKQKKQQKEETLTAQKTAEQLEKALTEIARLRKSLAEREEALDALQSQMQAETSKVEASDGQTALRVLAGTANQWGIEIDGQPVPLETLTTEQRQRLVSIIVQIRPWIDGKKIAPVPTEKASAPPAPEPSTPTGTPPPVARLSQTPIDTSSQAAPRINPLRGFRSMLANEVKKEAAPSLSIISMIDEILQQKLQGSALAGKSIRLEEGALGEVLVHIGAVRHSGIDSVPDPAIKAIIQEAIAEFNNSR